MSAATVEQLQLVELVELVELIDHQSGVRDSVEERDSCHRRAVSGREQFQQQLVTPALADDTRGEGPIAETAQSSEQRTGPQPEQNRAVWITIVALIVVLAAGYTIVKGSSTTSSPVASGTRAVVVPTADATRTVVVVPCGTGANVLSADATAVSQTTGTTTLELPQGGTQRVVVVPPCSGGHGAVAGSSQLPSAAFVPAPGTPPPAIGSSESGSPRAGAPDSAQFELTVPAGSPIRTIVLSPCQKSRPSGPAEQILSATGSSSTAVAPQC